MKLYLSFLSMALLIGQAAVDAQTAENSRQCVIHLNKSFYVSGEVIWYKVYFPFGFKDKNIVVRAGIWDQEGQMLSSVFHKSRGGLSVQGYYRIPFDIRSAVYHLVVSGSDLESKEPIILAEALAPIFNDMESNTPPVAGAARKDKGDRQGADSLPGASLQVSIELAPDPVQRRERATASIRVRDRDGKPISAGLSVSIRDHLLSDTGLSAKENIVAGRILEPGIELSLDSMISFQGSITDSLGRPMRVGILGLYSSQEQALSYTGTNEEGRFSFSLPDFSGSKPIQFLDYHYRDIKVVMRSDIKLEKSGELAYSPEVLSYISASRQRKKIFQLYNDLEYVLEQETPAFHIEPFDPDDTYRIRDYEPFGSIPRFFKEVTAALKFNEGDDGKFVAKMFNSESGRRGFYSGIPLFIIDGKLTWDAAFVAGLDIAQVEEVHLFNDRDKLRQRFNSLGAHGGVVTIKTNRPGLQLPASEEEDIFLIAGLQPEVVFPGTQPKTIEPHAPFLQPQLYWNPGFQTDEQGELQVEFIQSDDLSQQFPI